MDHKLSDNVTHQATQAYIPIIAVCGKEVGVCTTSHVKLVTNARRPVSVKFYVWGKQKWAGWYRTKSGINTNMYVESFHKLLKYVYMRGRINKRIDKLLHIQMKVATYKGFERLCKLKKGKFL